MTGTVVIYRQFLCIRACIGHHCEYRDGSYRGFDPQRQFVFLPICHEGSESDYRSRQRSWNPEGDPEGNGDIGRQVASYSRVSDMAESKWHPAEGPFYETGRWTVKGGPLTKQDGSGHMISEFEPIPCPKVKKGVETRWNDSRGWWEKMLKKGWTCA